eukprot:12885185-Prorocentrum_lima.AAC.1
MRRGLALPILGTPTERRWRLPILGTLRWLLRRSRRRDVNVAKMSFMVVPGTWLSCRCRRRGPCVVRA